MSQKTLKLLSYNTQQGIPMRGVHHYVLNSWRHLLPHRSRMQNLSNVAEMLAGYDVVALQEVDIGSFRSQHIDQVEYLSEQAGLLHRAQQVTRDLGRFAQYAKGILSRYPLHAIEQLLLPSVVPGRGVLVAQVGQGETKILLVNVHLSLSHKTQQRQLDFLENLVRSHRYVVVMGDLNLVPERLSAHRLIAHGLLNIANIDTLTFPSWKPRKCLDYVLLSPALSCYDVHVVPCDFSDHLPVSVTLQVPDEVII